MSPNIVLALGGLFCVAVAILSRVWLPYAETGLSDDAAFNHLAATAATVLGYAFASAYWALSGSSRERGHAAGGGGYGSVVFGWFAGLAACATTLLFAATYRGLEYRFFWTAQVLEYVLLAVVWVGATRMVGPSAQARESDAAVTAHRKTRISAELAALAAAARKFEADAGRALGKAVEALADEVRFFPAHASGAEASQLLADLSQWVQGAAAATAAVPAPSQLADLAEQAGLLRRRLSQWKRV